MPVSLAFTPGSIIRWHNRRFVVIECAALDSIVAREVGKRRLDRIPVNEAQPDYPVDDNTSSQMNLISVPEGQWVAASSRFDLLKQLLDMDSAERTRTAVLPSQCRKPEFEHRPAAERRAVGSAVIGEVEEHDGGRSEV